MQERGDGGLLTRALIATVLFAILLRLDAILSIQQALVDLGWSSAAVLAAITVARLAIAAVAVLALLPALLGMRGVRKHLSRYLRLDARGALLGALSFVLFALLATGLAAALGIFRGDTSLVFARPDVRAAPAVIGWGYLLLALVPGIWEELAFRGFVQSRLRAPFGAAGAIALSAGLFGLCYLASAVTDSPGEVVSRVILATLFGLGWGYMTLRSGSVIPAIISHYLVDSLGKVYMAVDMPNRAAVSGFYLLLSLLFPLLVILLTGALYRKSAAGGQQGP